MEDDSKVQTLVKAGLGTLGLGAIAAALVLPRPVGFWIALVILVLALLLFGGYYLWQRQRARRQREQFSSAIETQTAAAPRAISDPKKRADLDKVRGKFQTGLQEFKSRGKDIYKLPWYVIIGESGSGKTEAIRHSEIDFPPGLNKEHQGTGGTVNMDWWFTNRGVILDTAGSMVFPEAGAGQAPEWQEFLRLLKKARPQCPINGLLLVLSIESLIRDSAEKIGQKASRLAQHLDLIQRTLDVRFPVYLLVTKADLLTGFREFFDSIEDPLLQHQMFGWSNPDPLDSPFRPDLVDQHLTSVADRLRRRRMALLRESAGAGRIGDTAQFFGSSYQLGRGPAAAARRLDEVDSMFALPESLMRLAPRLRRYLENIFVAGEWSAKPVFLRGIYFTSSMREGKALDEAIAFATGLALDQLPDDRTWDKNRAFFLRDLFHEKVFRESGLVTRATNTLKLLRQRQMAIFGTAGAALLIFLIVVVLASRSLQKSIRREAADWKAGAESWKESAGSKTREWLPGAILHGVENYHFVYSDTNLVPSATLDGTNLTVISYQAALKRFVERKFHVPLIFLPVSFLSNVRNRPEAQAAMFEAGILRPLVAQTRVKMQNQPLPAGDSPEADRHREALLALIRLETDKVSKRGLARTNAAQAYLKAFISYLTDTNHVPDATLVETFNWTYANNRNPWPPKGLLGGDRLSNNVAILKGLDGFRKVNETRLGNISKQGEALDKLVAALTTYAQAEGAWLGKTADFCPAFAGDLTASKKAVDQNWNALQGSNSPLMNVTAKYNDLMRSVRAASGEPFKDIMKDLDEPDKTTGIISDIQRQVANFGAASAGDISNRFDKVKSPARELDANYLVVLTNRSEPCFQTRWALYQRACAIENTPATPAESVLGDGWQTFSRLKTNVDGFRNGLAAYNGPLAGPTTNACIRIAGNAEQRLVGSFLDGYCKLVAQKLLDLPIQPRWDMRSVTNARAWYGRIEYDLTAKPALEPEQQQRLAVIPGAVANSKKETLVAIKRGILGTIGFPVVRAAKNEMRSDDLKSLKFLLEGLGTELGDPVWRSDTSGAQAELLKSRDLYARVVSVLGNDDGSPVEWELWFVPPEPSRQDDADLVKFWREIKVIFGSAATPWFDLGNLAQPTLIKKGRVDEALKISFRERTADTESTPPGFSFTAWGMARAICNSPGGRLEDGLKWQFQVPLEHGETHKPGKVTLEVRVDAKKPLPKLDGEWP